MRAQQLAGPVLIAAALLAAIPLAQVREGAHSPGSSAAAQRDHQTSRPPATP
ncbi:MAG TPA: hypothetical protein VH353_02835 [Caulobacteraceae bacterium]|nr:hypothetical protein [Caulobacteraceae bacterium]